MSDTVKKNLGHATAYAYAVAGGYTGTEEEYTELMGSVATIAESAAESARQAAGSADNANADALKSEGLAVGEQNGAEVGSGSPYYNNNAKYYKEQAANSATTASNKAGEASDSAVTAGQKADAASGSASSAAAGALKAEGYAQGKQNGTDVGSGSPYYHANAKYYSDQASGSATTAGQKATAASGSATTAGDKALIAEGYANGKQNGSDVASGSPYYHNNSKYYSDQAAGSAEAAAASAQSVSDSAAQIQTNKEDIEDLQEGKANKDGSYENMTVGNAEQIVSTVFVEDNEPYQFRTAGGSADIGDREYDEIVGGTVVWNQQILNGNFEDTSAWQANTVAYGTFTVNNNVATFTVGASSVEKNSAYFRNAQAKNKNGHVLLGIINVNPSRTTIVRYLYPNAASGTVSTECPSNVWTCVANVVKAISDTNGSIFYFNISNAMQENDTILFKNSVVFDLTQMFGSTIADYIYSLEQATSGAGVAWFRKLFPASYYAYNAGELMSVQTSKHKMVGFNQWDEEWEVGGLDSTGQPVSASNAIRSKNYCNAVGGATYYLKCGNYTNRYYLAIVFYDESKNFISSTFMSGATVTAPINARYFKIKTNNSTYIYGGTYLNDICINLSWDGERDGEYEPYQAWEYPLDSDLELRGIPKLDANNKLYYNGDTYESDGTVTRRFVKVTLNGSENWVPRTERNKYFSTQVGAFGYVVNDDSICDTWDYNPTLGAADSNVGYRVINSSGYNGAFINVRPRGYVDIDVLTFKAQLAAHPVTLIYGVSSPTIESASPFQNPQIVENFGTEEYVTTSIVPVGHYTKYANNLRAKLEMAPDSPNGDGDYIVRQTSGQNAYVPLVIPNELPTAPTENGNYILKCTVSGGTPTYSWEVQS